MTYISKIEIIEKMEFIITLLQCFVTTGVVALEALNLRHSGIPPLIIAATIIETALTMTLLYSFIGSKLEWKLWLYEKGSFRKALVDVTYKFTFNIKSDRKVKFFVCIFLVTYKILCYAVISFMVIKNNIFVLTYCGSFVSLIHLIACLIMGMIPLYYLFPVDDFLITKKSISRIKSKINDILNKLPCLIIHDYEVLYSKDSISAAWNIVNRIKKLMNRNKYVSEYCIVHVSKPYEGKTIVEKKCLRCGKHVNTLHKFACDVEERYRNYIGE